MHDGTHYGVPSWTYEALKALASLVVKNANAFNACPFSAWHYGTVHKNTYRNYNGIPVNGPIAKYLDDRFQAGCGFTDCHQTWHNRVYVSGGYSSPIITFDCEDALGADAAYCCLTMPSCKYEIGIIPGKRISHAVGRLNGDIRDMCVPGGMKGQPEYNKAVWLTIKEKNNGK